MSGKKILIIDDSETVLEYLQLVLEDRGYEVIALDSAALFAATLNRAKPDLALVDVSMPVVRGQLLVGLARRHQLHPCVIALHSSLPEETLRALASECGADGYVRRAPIPTCWPSTSSACSRWAPARPPRTTAPGRSAAPDRPLDPPSPTRTDAAGPSRGGRDGGSPMPRPLPALAASLAAAASLLSTPGAALALEIEGVSIHGFGSVADGLVNRGNQNEYLSANTKGSLVESSLALAIGARPLERLNVFGQIRAQGKGLDLGVNLDWAFAEWAFSDALKLRAGRCKLPLGFYSETRDVGTLRPFLYVPQSVYGLVELAADAYNGLGLTGGSHAESGWGLDYDVFAGDLTATISQTEEYARQGQAPFDPNAPPGSDPNAGNASALAATIQLKAKLAGLRLTLSTPVEGLRLFGAGYYAAEESSGQNVVVGGAGAELFRERLSARLESFVVHKSNDDLSVGAYVELAYHVLTPLQLAARAEIARVTLKDQDTSLPGGASLLEHAEAALGINYWFSPQLVLKLSFHYVDGNLFSQPTDLFGALASGTLDRQTLVMNLGAQFSF
ncbi:MAG: response regulator [Myxococcales bacterium]